MHKIKQVLIISVKYKASFEASLAMDEQMKSDEKAGFGADKQMQALASQNAGSYNAATNAAANSNSNSNQEKPLDPQQVDEGGSRPILPYSSMFIFGTDNM